jgi:hypothetical protein
MITKECNKSESEILRGVSLQVFEKIVVIMVTSIIAKALIRDEA